MKVATLLTSSAVCVMTLLSAPAAVDDPIALASTSALTAVEPCQGALANNYAGAYTPYDLLIFGARARIEVRSPALCGTYARFSIAWSLVTADNPTQSGGFGYAQVGYGNFAKAHYPVHDGYWEFAQYVKLCGAPCPFTTKWGRRLAYQDALDTTARYNDGKIHMTIDDRTIAVTPWSPDGVWNPEWQAEYEGETLKPQSDIPGTNVDPATFLNSATKDGSGVWHIRSSRYLSLLSTEPRYNRAFSNPTQNGNFRIWTYPLDGMN